MNRIQYIPKQELVFTSFLSHWPRLFWHYSLVGTISPITIKKSRVTGEIMCCYTDCVINNNSKFVENEDSVNYPSSRSQRELTRCMVGQWKINKWFTASCTSFISLSNIVGPTMIYYIAVCIPWWKILLSLLILLYYIDIMAVLQK